MVYDTSSRAPVELEARHLVLTRPGEDGSRSVLDLIIVRNGGRLTRVAPDTTSGSWSVPLPRGTTGLQVQESDVSSEALRRSGDSLIIAAALAPGEKQLTLEYQVPSDRSEHRAAVEPCRAAAQRSGGGTRGQSDGSRNCSGRQPADSEPLLPPLDRYRQVSRHAPARVARKTEWSSVVARGTGRWTGRRPRRPEAGTPSVPVLSCGQVPEPVD